jgi:DNA-binding transcriptional regulator YiaG
MKYFYDRKSDSLYLTLAERQYADSLEAAPGVVLDFDKDGRLIGLDLERASRTVDVSDLEVHEEPAGTDAHAAHTAGTNLKREREALGFSQAELGRKLSVSSNTIARWERGELKIEHPAMLQLAMATLRRSSPDRVAIPPHMATTRIRTSSDAERVKKK